MKNINTKQRFIICIITLMLLFTSLGYTQVCAIPTNDGSNLTLSGTVNSYWSVATGTYNAGSTSIALQSQRGSVSPLSSGDLVMVIQMQCADIDLTNTDAYGDGVSGDTQFGSPVASGYSDPVGSCLAGQYEYVRAGVLSNATTLDLSDNPLTNTYVQAVANATTGRRTLQILRVPQYNNATLTGNVTSVDWDGFSGGIVALDITRTLDLNSNTIDVDGSGFRGGGGRERSSDDANIRYRWDVDDRHATKGEGIAGTPRFVGNKREFDPTFSATITDLGAAWGGYPDGLGTDGDFARGAPGNAGGGGNFWNGTSDNGGGGGGSNGGAGGRGGVGWNSAGYAGILADYSNFPQKKWGFGGSAFSSASVSRLILGGGGGAGDNNNNSTPEQSSGAAGGGIVMIRARSIIGTGTVTARGAWATRNTLNDGAGAGGAGGSIAIIARDMSLATLAVNASGGRGGDTWITGGSAHGTGAGGGGGVVVRTGSATVDVTGGANGLTNTSDSPPGGAAHGGTSGSTGLDLVITVPTDVPGVNTGFRCLDFSDAPLSYGLADHNLGHSPEILYLGAIIADGNSETIANIPSANADADDLNTTDDEDCTNLPTSSTGDGTYTVTTIVFNNTGSNANFCGWVDFDQDGIFQSDESICATVNTSVSSQSIDLIFTVPLVDRNNTGTIFARFRLTTDALTTSTPTGSSGDGEVEDFMTTMTTLPVSLNGFESHKLSNGLLIKWNTASETRNIGFYIWGDSGKQGGTGFSRISEKIIPSKSQGALDPQKYELTLPIKYKNYSKLAISSIDSQGREELYGLYDVNKNYGRKNIQKNINWQNINEKISSKSSVYHSSNKSIPNIFAEVHTLKAQIKTNNYGIYRITYEELVDAGLDLLNVEKNSIAVTVNDNSIARRIGSGSLLNDLIFVDGFESGEDSNSTIVTNQSLFGPGMFIDFWSIKPSFPDAEYVDFYTYEISINQNLVKLVELEKLSAAGQTTSYQHSLSINEDNEYSFTNTSPDPWYAKLLKDYTTEEDKFYAVNFTIENDLITSLSGTLSIKLIGGADFPINPDHQVQINVNGSTLTTYDFDGIESVTLKIPLPANTIHYGNNAVEVRLTGGTSALYDLVLVDEVTLTYPKPLSLMNNFLNIKEQIINNNLALINQNHIDLNAYSIDADGNMKFLELSQRADNIILIAHSAGVSSYWIASNESLYKSNNIAVIEKDDLLSNSAEFLIVAHPAFMPNDVSQEHPLNRYIQYKAAEGWNLRTISIKDIQRQYGGGMPLPDALTKFLKTANRSFEFSHVLLVGGDSYDYLDRLGLQSVSFIPTKYAATLYIQHTPSDQLLTDLNNDGISDKAIGRWPVRTLDDLSSIVDKTILWNNNRSVNAIFVTDTQDDINGSFESQSERLIDVFIDNNWDQDSILKIYTDQMNATSSIPAQDLVREQMFNYWESANSLTSYIGHGSPTQWSRSGIINANDLDDLSNSLTPTLIGTLTCYTSYFVSPRTDTLAHLLLNNGDGAVAIHGASSLSAYSSNEQFAKTVIELQLLGKTLGEAVQEARIQALMNGYKDQVINWTLLGDPTLVVNHNN